MGSNRRNAANILKGEKEILHYYLTFTERNIALLEMDWESFTDATSAAEYTEGSYVTTVLSKLIEKKPVSPSSYDASTVQALGILSTLVAILSVTNWFKDPKIIKTL